MKNGDADAWADGEFAQAFRRWKMRYHSGWYIIDDAPQILFALGIHGQHLFVDIEHRMVIAKLSSHAVALDVSAIELTLRSVAEFRRIAIADSRGRGVGIDVSICIYLWRQGRTWYPDVK